MARLKFTIHPLFILFGIYFVIIGKVYSFLIFTLSAIIHEMGHYLAAQKLGYALKRVVLMPYGAVIYGNTKGISYRDEAFIALSGPMLSLFIACLLVSLWWLAPTLYPYTEVCVLANLCIATINLLPAYPLDGGRVFTAILSCYIKPSKALKISKGAGILTAGAIFTLFIYSVVIKLANYSLLFFALFILFGNIFVGKDLLYEKIASYFSIGDLKVGKKVNKIAISKDFTVRQLKNIYKYGELLEISIYDNKSKKVCDLSCESVIKVLSTGSLNDTVYNVYKCR